MNKSNKRLLYVITGGSSGIGLAIARKAAAAGINVWIVARDDAKLKTAVDSIKMAGSESEANHGYIAADLTDYQSAKKMALQILEKAGVPDVLINSAGAAHPGYIETLEIKIFHWMMEANYFTTVNSVKAFLPSMIARKRGHIVNVSSVAGFLGVFGYTAYSASKFAITGFSKVLKSEMKRFGITVSVVYPPDTNTPQLEYENQFKPKETKAIAGTAKAASPEKVAAAVLRKIRKKKFNIHPTSDVAFFYIIQKLLPDKFIFWILDQLSKTKN